MADSLPPLAPDVTEQLAKALGKAATGTQLTSLIAQVGLRDPFGPSSTKWKRLDASFSEDQTRYRQANRVLACVEAVLSPARFTDNPEEFEAHRERANRALAFAGYHLRSDGRLAQAPKASTLTEAQQRASQLRADLVNRRVHPDVLHFCREELVVPNYFHAVFEATKSVAEKLRQKSGLVSDGAELVDGALGLGKTGTPLLALNSLQTDTERSEQKGLAMLIKGMFGAFRNVTAHAPKVTWKIEEQDALDMLTLASLLHRRLDSCVATGRT